jgi:hypothetical protein
MMEEPGVHETKAVTRKMTGDRKLYRHMPNR